MRATEKLKSLGLLRSPKTPRDPLNVERTTDGSIPNQILADVLVAGEHVGVIQIRAKKPQNGKRVLSFDFSPVNDGARIEEYRVSQDKLQWWVSQTVDGNE